VPSPEQLFDLVRLAIRMRRKQVEYFGSGRSSQALAAARDLERKFDHEARTLLGTVGEVRQPGSINPPLR
jgi:hypothetical protein